MRKIQKLETVPTTPEKLATLDRPTESPPLETPNRRKPGVMERTADYNNSLFAVRSTAPASGQCSAERPVVNVLREGLLLTHFAIRQLMAQAAWPCGLDPDQLSFTHAVRVIKRKMPQAAAVPPP